MSRFDPADSTRLESFELEHSPETQGDAAAMDTYPPKPIKVRPHESAFPICVDLRPEEWNVEYGLTKREYFAAKALQGLLAGGSTANLITVKSALRTADTLIDALNE